MKKLLCIFLCAAAGLIAMGNAPYKAEFSISGFFPESRTEAAVIRTVDEMDGFIEEILEEVRNRDEGHIWPAFDSFENYVREYYAAFDGEFFAENNLIAALLERGSGSLRFSLDGLKPDGDTLKISVRRTCPMMQTMDYRTHSMTLSVCKAEFDAPKAEVIIIK